MASNSGKAGAAVCTCLDSKAKSGPYGMIGLQWWNKKKERYEMRCAEVGCGDGSDGKLKANAFYKLSECGEFKEVEAGKEEL